MEIGFNRISYRNRYRRRDALDECAADDESVEGCWKDRDASMRENGSTACGKGQYMLFGGVLISGAAVRPLKEEGRVSSKVEVASGSSRREVGTGQERSVGWDMLCFPKARRLGGAEECALALGLVQIGQQCSTSGGPR
jgi:hypothetical protein